MDQCDWGGDYDDLHANGVSAYFIATRCDDGGLRLRLVLRSLPRGAHEHSSGFSFRRTSNFWRSAWRPRLLRVFQRCHVRVCRKHNCNWRGGRVNDGSREDSRCRVAYQLPLRVSFATGWWRATNFAGGCAAGRALYACDGILPACARSTRCAMLFYRLWPRGHCNSATRIGPEQTNSRWWIDHLPPGPE